MVREAPRCVDRRRRGEVRWVQVLAMLEGGELLVGTLEEGNSS